MIRRLLLLNGLAIIAVVLNHAIGWGYTAMFWWTDRYAAVTVPNYAQIGSFDYYLLRTIEQLVIFAVPAFLFVSGFFMAIATNRSRANVAWALIGARIRGLAIPYLLWSILIFVVMFLEGQRQSATGYLRLLITGRTAPPYYFVPLLIQLYLLSPLLVPAARKNWKLLLIFTAIIQLCIRTLSYLNIIGALPLALRPLMVLTPGWFFPGHLFWFAAGIVIGFNLDSLKLILARTKWMLLAFALILFALGMVEWEMILRASSEPWIAPAQTLLDNLYAASFILTFLAFSDAKIPFASQLGEWGSRSFGIYLAHALVLQLTARAIAVLAPSLLSQQLLFQAILIIPGLAIPLLLMSLANTEKSPVRPYFQYLFG